MITNLLHHLVCHENLTYPVPATRHFVVGRARAAGAEALLGSRTNEVEAPSQQPEVCLPLTRSRCAQHVHPTVKQPDPSVSTRTQMVRICSFPSPPLSWSPSFSAACLAAAPVCDCACRTHERALSSAACLATPSLERELDAAARGCFELLLGRIVQQVVLQAVAQQCWHVSRWRSRQGRGHPNCQRVLTARLGV